MSYPKLERRKPERRILSMQEQAAILGVSVRTHERTCKRGDGPEQVRVSARLAGAFEDTFYSWLQGRTKQAAS